MKAPAFLRRRVSPEERPAALNGRTQRTDAIPVRKSDGGDSDATIVLGSAQISQPEVAPDGQRSDPDSTMVINRASVSHPKSAADEPHGDADSTMVLGRAPAGQPATGASTSLGDAASPALPALRAPSTPSTPSAQPAALQGSTAPAAQPRGTRNGIRSHAKIRDRTRVIITGTGEGLITLGVIILLFCVYQLYYTNVEANRAQAEERAELRENWEQPPARPESTESTDPVSEDFSDVLPSDGIAIMHIPRLGDSWEKPVLEGVDLDLLARGLGHYPDAAMPGEIGNFAVAGHRMTHGEPFRNLDQLQPGDVVIVETEHNWYRYVMDEWEIVLPTQVDVVAPVPKQPGVEPTEPLITLTTCHPRWSSEKRLIWWGHLESVQSKAEGTPPELS